MKRILIMATFILTATLVVGNYRINQIETAKITKSISTLSDHASIELPKTISRISGSEERVSLDSVINKGDFLTLDLGYQNVQTYREFEGFVKDVKIGNKLTVECEDANYLLKRTTIEKSWKTTTLKEVVSYMVDQVNIDNPDYTITLSAKVPDIALKNYEVDNISVSQALHLVEEELGMVSYFRGFELYTGLQFTDTQSDVNINLAHNVISHSLKKITEEDSKMSLKAIALLPNNKQLTVTVPESKDTHQLRTKIYTNIDTLEELKTVALEDLKTLRFNGLKGSLKTFLIPQVTHGDVVNIGDPLYKLLDGNYVVSKVVTTLGRGIRRDITPQFTV